MIKTLIFATLLSIFSGKANASLFSEDGHEEICADDLGMGVQLNIDGSDVQTGGCENTDPDMDLSELQIGDDRDFIRDKQGATR